MLPGRESCHGDYHADAKSGNSSTVQPFRLTLVVRMSIPAPLVLILLALVPAAVASEPAPRDGIELAQLIFHQRIVIRIPRLDAPPPMPLPKPQRWAEKKGPKCVSLDTLGAAV